MMRFWAATWPADPAANGFADAARRSARSRSGTCNATTLAAFSPARATLRATRVKSRRTAPAIPTLDSVLRIDPATRWTIEIKSYPNRPWLTAPPERMAEEVAAVADATGMADRIVVQSFDWRGPRHLRRLRPDLAYAWLTTRQTRAWRGGQASLPASVAAEGGGTWSPHHSELTERKMAQAHAMGLRVVPWTVNNPADQRRLAGWGVDGIITDDPVALSAWLHPASPG